MSTSLNELLLQLTKRAEANATSKLVETFVQVGPLLPLLVSRDHQVFYGRRGTGKTHALTYLSETVKSRNDIAAYVDLRTVGSSVGMYADSSIPTAERATRLILDLLALVHSQILTQVIESKDLDLSKLGPLLDTLAEESSRVEVRGEVTTEKAETSGIADTKKTTGGLGISNSGIAANFSAENQRRIDSQTQTKSTINGTMHHSINFAGLSQAFLRLSSELGSRRIWILLDEWSSLPLELQPLLADLLRRAVLPVRGITLKIAAIEHRSKFQTLRTQGDYQGVELGADISATLNLDDFMVFNNDANNAKTFFRELLFKHVAAETITTTDANLPDTPEKLQQVGFTQHNAFDEFVRASEGVPRDGINIISIAAQRAGNNPLSVMHIRAAASAWYRRDKEPAVGSNPKAKLLLHWITEEVIGKRKARAFLLASDVSHKLIEFLFDQRVIHVLKKGALPAFVWVPWRARVV